MQEIREEKTVFMNQGVVMLDFDKQSAVSILCQAMMDETLRLRKCRRKKKEIP